MNISVVEILNTGVTGFAFIMLYLGYRLTSSVQSKILGKNPEDFQTIEYFREWKELVRNQVINTRYFMLFAAIFFTGGLGLLMYQSESKIILTISPVEGIMPKIFHQIDKVELGENGRANILVKSEHNISVNIEHLMNLLTKANLEIEDLKSANRDLVTETVSESSEAGFALK